MTPRERALDLDRRYHDAVVRGESWQDLDEMTEAIEAAVVEERVACVKIAERTKRPEPHRSPRGLTAEEIAEAIKARSDDAQANGPA